MAVTGDLVQADGDAFQSLDSSQTLKAAKVLLRHIEEEAKSKPPTEKKSLFDDADDETGESSGAAPIWLVIATKRHVRQDESLKPIRVALPHPLNQDPSRTICIVSATPQRAYKNIVASEQFPEELRNRISRVIDLGKLQKKFKQYEEQRLLYHEHDIFLADDRIINRLPKALGKTFYKSTAKRPIPVIFSAKRRKPHAKPTKKTKDNEVTNVGTVEDIAAEIYKAIGAAQVTLRAAENVSVIVGYSNFTPEQLAANVEAVTKEVVMRRIAQKWDNVKGIYIKGPETTTFPIWQTTKLWVDDTDVVADGTKQQKAIKSKEKSKEKANSGKKRKSIDAPAAQKTKRAKQEAVPESNDDRLDKEIALRKERLAKQKAAAKAAMDD